MREATIMNVPKWKRPRVRYKKMWMTEWKRIEAGPEANDKGPQSVENFCGAGQIPPWHVYM